MVEAVAVQEQRTWRRLNLFLRTRHVDYLEYIAELKGISQSGAMREIIHTQRLGTSPSYRAPLKTRLPIILDAVEFSILDQMAAKLGVFRSDIARRLIDAAIESDPQIYG